MYLYFVTFNFWFLFEFRNILIFQFFVFNNKFIVIYAKKYTLVFGIWDMDLKNICEQDVAKIYHYLNFIDVITNILSNNNCLHFRCTCLCLSSKRSEYSLESPAPNRILLFIAIDIPFKIPHFYDSIPQSISNRNALFTIPQ